MSKLSNETQEKLEYLYLYNTSLTGNLTGWLKKYKMTSLKSLGLSENNLNGTIPADIGNLTNLVEWDLSENSFTGEVSELHLTRLSKLTILRLFYNSITVTIGSNWAPLFQLEYLDASACVLGPKFPSSLQNQNNLTEVYLSNTRIVDSVPDWFWNLSSLSSIDLSHNSITGKLPESDCSYALTSLQVIDLSSNSISGDLLHCFPNTLEVVNLANNKITGTIPSSVGGLNMLKVLQLNNNNLIGEFPSSLQFCKNLIVIDFGENQFYGQIPEWLGENLTSLTVLRLRSNSFSGYIPSQLTHLGNLQVLDLSCNNISGLIPQNLDMLTAMALPNHDGQSNSTLYNIPFYNLSISVTE